MDKTHIDSLTQLRPHRCCSAFISLAALFGIAACFFNVPQSISAIPLPGQSHLIRCSQIVEDLERLHCYDNLASTLVTKNNANNEQQPLVNDRLGEKYLRESSTDEHPEIATLTLKKAYKNNRKLWVFEFKNGQIWRQLEPRYLSLPKSFPVEVIISEGAFGSYNLRISNKGITIKVKRIK